MKFNRDIYDTLIAWSQEKGGLLLKGARQVGKTFILKELGEDCFSHVLFVNLREKKVAAWFDKKSAESFKMDKWAGIFTEYAKLTEQEFNDSTETLVILDEIQSSVVMYNGLRDMVREHSFKVAATGSFLGIFDIEQSRDSGVFHAAGDIRILTMYPMTYKEVINAALSQKVADLETIFNFYVRFGGFPEVVVSWLENRNALKCPTVLERIYGVLVSESQHYFEGMFPEAAWTDTLASVVAQIETKKAVPFSEKLTYKFRTAEGLDVTKTETIESLRWMVACNLLFLGDVTNKLKTLERVKYSYYFTDQGLMSLIIGKSLNQASARFNKGSMLGLLTENFVALNIGEFMRPRSYSKNNPQEEIDFIAEMYGIGLVGIEVKAGQETTPSSLKALNRGDIKQIIKIQGKPEQDSEGIMNLPLYRAHELGSLLGYPADRHKYNQRNELLEYRADIPEVDAINSFDQDSDND